MIENIPALCQCGRPNPNAGQRRRSLKEHACPRCRAVSRRLHGTGPQTSGTAEAAAFRRVRGESTAAIRRACDAAMLRRGLRPETSCHFIHFED